MHPSVLAPDADRESDHAEPESDAEPESAEPEAGTGNILIVDDNPANLTALEAALGDFGGRIVRAHSGTEALGRLLVEDFALILLDVRMPSMGGLETARMIRRRKRSRHTPIIFVTAAGRDDCEVCQAYELGAVDFLFKPLVAEMLQAKVSVFAELHRRAAQVALQAGLLRKHERTEHNRTLESERRRWESDLLQAQMHDFAVADRRKDDFLALLGHELRNPLMPIVVGLELVREKLSKDASADAESLRTCETMQRQARHLTRLVDDLLDISRISAGKIELRRANVSMQDIIGQALAMSQPLLDERTLRVSLDLPPEPVLVCGDSVRLVQTIANLLTNAARYTEPGGSIHIGCKELEGFVETSVVDTGRGIAPEFLPRIFDTFAQERSANGGGLGLGLSLAAQLVGLHGGTISAFSDGLGRGSRFVVRLPAEVQAVQAPETKPPPLPSTEREPKALTIALVDDQPDIRELMQELLVTWGHAVETAKDGQTGIDLILRLRPDVAIVDIGLPDMNGYDVAATVRRTLGPDALRLVALTGFGGDSDRARSAQAGFDTHLVKPVDMNALKKVLSFEER